jgi:ATP-dependent DNA helicase DinG
VTDRDVDALLRRAVEALDGEERSGQVAMARAVEDALANGRHALIQAGTGTGKSLGYLVPTVAHAVGEDARVVISTATIALQRQVFLKDLPLVLDALAPVLGARPSSALLKGRANYLCRHKLGGGYPEAEDVLDVGPVGATSALGKEVARLAAWANETETGDRDDLDPGVSARAWAQVSVGGRECLGPQCPAASQCFAERALVAARSAQIVVTNHAMLAIEATSHEVLGPHAALIVDEAHELVSRITSNATAELTAPLVALAARAARRAGAGVSECDALEAAARALGAALESIRVGRLAFGLPEGLAVAVAAARDAARVVLRGVEAAKKEDGAAAKVATARLAETIDMADALLGDTSPLVVWLAPADGDYGSTVAERILSAPLDVAGLVRYKLLEETAAVFTSATLALGGSFDAMARQLGVEDPVTLDAGSPFDHAAQGILYVASHLDRPGSGGIAADALDELADLITAAGGRTLGLFSSHRAAVDATEAMRARLDFPVMYQKDDQVATLLARFRADPRACLFGSTTLWQGVDLPGDTCTLVVIDRVPFPRPDDPIAQARAEAVDAAGGSGFMAVSASHAALLLAQGSGRLIRTLTDRGVVAILDSRVATARYGGFLVRSLPPLWPTTDRVLVLDALRRLDSERRVDSERDGAA